MKDLYPRQEGRDLKSKDPNKKVQSNWPFCLALTLFIMWVELIFLPEHATALGCNTMWHTCLNQLSQGTCKTWACTSLFTEHGLSFLPALFLSLSVFPLLYFSSPLDCCCTFPPPQVVICSWRLCGRRSALSGCVLTAPSSSRQLAGHRQPRECSTNCAGHRGYAASLSLFYSFCFCLQLFDVVCSPLSTQLPYNNAWHHSLHCHDK